MRWGWLVALSILAGACAPPLTSEALSQREFRDHMVKAILAADPSAEVDVTNDLQFKLTRKGGLITYVDLNSGYDEYLNDISQLDGIVSRWKALVVDAPPAATDLSKRIIYLVRNAAYVGPPPGLKPGETYSTALWRPLAGDMVAVLMAYDGTILSGVLQEHLDESQITEAEAWRNADDNLKSRLGPITIGDLNGDGPTAYSADSGLATGLLAHPDSCTGVSGLWNDGRVILVVDRNVFIMTLPNDPLSVERFWAFAKRGLQAHEFVSETPLTCRNGKWELAEIPR